MDTNKYVDTNGKQIKVGDRVKFRAHYGYQNHKVIESEGEVVSLNIYQQVIVKLPKKCLFPGRDGMYSSDLFTLHGSYDYDKGVSVFGAVKQVFQFDTPTELSEYCFVV